MSAEQGGSSWDFPTSLYDFVQQPTISGETHIASKNRRTTENEASGDSSSSLDQPVTPVGKDTETSLGNLGPVWKLLRQPFHVPPPVVPVLSYPNGNEPKEPKIVKWRDEIDGADLADNDDAGDSLSFSGLTKKQRKKANRKHRKALAEKYGPDTAAAATASSENESEKEMKKERTLDRTGVIHNLLYGPSPMVNGLPTTRRVQVLKRPQLPIDTEAWPEAKPHASIGNHRASSEPAPTAYAAAAARKETLMTMLKERFPKERQYLNSIVLFHHTNDDSQTTPEGLHVFIDASNIMIGFHDALKTSRSLPKEQYIRRQPFSFHSLSLLLTRGRPTSKLVLVGSDNFPAITEAKTLGYETNILDRVHKAKELTPRQKKLFSKSGKGDQSAGSGSETSLSAATHADKKWVEQAVDEILHLKMMESVVDCAEPGTMVLGSGDAAEAEYSGGFLKMVERALGKGWMVEVACFRANTSGMYRRKEFREKWAGRFKLVELDDFVEVLLGVE